MKNISTPSFTISVSQTILFLLSNLVSFPIVLLFLHFFSLLTPSLLYLNLPLLNLLASSNLPPPLLNWLHSYLLNRTQRVVVKGSSSSSLFGFPHTFFKSILPNLSTFCFLTNLSPTLTLSPTLPYPGFLLSVSPPFATLASFSLLLFHSLLTSLLSASNLVNSLACYSDTFLLTLLLQLSLNSTFLLSAQSLNTGVSSGTLLLLPSLNPLTLSNTLLLKLLPNSALRSFLLYYPPSIFLPLPPVTKRLN